jgi:gamma-glutamyltranspeptidase
MLSEYWRVNYRSVGYRTMIRFCHKFVSGKCIVNVLRDRIQCKVLTLMVLPKLGGSVVSENALASAIGIRVLARGGNAVDAIIATTIAVHTTSPYHSDLGGGGFAIIRTPGGNFESLNFRSTAPVSGQAY